MHLEKFICMKASGCAFRTGNFFEVLCILLELYTSVGEELDIEITVEV